MTEYDVEPDDQHYRPTEASWDDPEQYDDEET